MRRRERALSSDLCGAKEREGKKKGGEGVGQDVGGAERKERRAQGRGEQQRQAESGSAGQMRVAMGQDQQNQRAWCVHHRD